MFYIELHIEPLAQKIKHTDKIMLMGSCFAENISAKLAEHKFDICTNPHGILFNPLSVADSINSYIEQKQYTEDDLFYLNELWNSWEHHSRFSHIDKDAALSQINQSQEQAHRFISSADYLIISLGTAYQYYRKDSGMPVSNNHKAPSQEFEKVLLPIEEITNSLSDTIEALENTNPNLQILFTVSPVRHIRDGVVENNRSKARLLEAVHDICGRYEQVHYFPAYELLIDVLRDYRFYDTDLVHPNKQAVSYIWERFMNSCMEDTTLTYIKEIAELNSAYQHRPRFEQTEGHQQFLAVYAKKLRVLREKYPHINWSEEEQYFSL
ncbi:MAG: GSCFA domain-containing protein [Flavipsychrobacter sp.]